MTRRARYSLLLLAAVAVAVGVVGWFPDGRRMWSYYPAPEGAVLRCRADQDREWSWGGTTPHSGGGMPGLPRRQWGATTWSYALSQVPPRKAEHWVAWSPELPGAPLLIGDLWFDPAQKRVVVGTAARSVALPGAEPRIPQTCRQATRMRDVEIEFPIDVAAYPDVPAIGATRTQCSVTAFGAVEPGAAGHVIRQEWSPSPDGCFTRWWESPDVPQQRYGRYRPPWKFDRIDRRTTVYISQTKATKGRFSNRALLYRLGDTVTGVYWPDLQFRRDREPGAMQFRHVFGRCDEAGRTVIELLGVDASGLVWRFADTAASFGLEAGRAMHPHDRSHAPESANDWLRYDVHDVESLLCAGPVPEPHLIERQ